MRRYEQVSGAVFSVMALAQLIRSVLGLPAQVGSFSIPVWFSVIAFVITGTLALWAFRVARGGTA
jgi:hypothetical protein